MATNERRYREAERRFWDDVGLRPSERRIRLPRIGAEVRVQETGEGEPVVFVHGALNAGTTWAPMLASLDGFRCLLVDRPGTGLSGPITIGPSELSAYGARFVGDLLDGLGLAAAHVVASSFGGHLALRSAAAEPERIRRMVQMGCPALSPGETFPPFMRGLRFASVRRIITMAPPNERAGRVIFRQMGHGASLAAGRIHPGLWRWSEALQRHTGTFASDVAMLGRLLNHRGPRSDLVVSGDVLSGVRAPTLFLWGADDGFGGLDVGRRLVDAMPDAHLVGLPASGHLPWLDHPGPVAAATSAFLSGVAPSDLPPLEPIEAEA